jgi:hypothetical protein
VSHHHGRRDAVEVEKLLAGYSRSEGALYAKHLHTGLPPRYIAQYAMSGRWKDLKRVAGGMVSAGLNR